MTKNISKIKIEQVLKALGDPVRLSAVRQVLNSVGEEKTCGTFEHDLTKATFSHHIKILKDAEVFISRNEGTRKFVSLNGEIKKKFPDLIKVIKQSK